MDVKFFFQPISKGGIKGQLSRGVPVLSGVIQGSVLEPLLFVLFVNDIPDLIQANVRMFADDTKIYSALKIFMIIRCYKRIWIT